MLPTEVKYWLVERGVGHVVVEARSFLIWSIVRTACRQSFKNHWPSKDQPARVCRKCRRSIKNATLVRYEESAGLKGD